MKYLKMLRNMADFVVSLRAMRNTNVNENKYHLDLAGRWLMRAQAINNNGGYPHSYSLCDGWQPSYPETTGYLIPTMLNLGMHLNDEKYLSSAIQAGNWLLTIQQVDGSFTDLSGKKQLFDTGQIVEGLVELYKKTNDAKFIHAAIKAGNFIVEKQDTDGKWTTYSYNNYPHSYYTRVSANLLRLYETTGENVYKISAENNLRWTIKQQMDNGYFNYLSFTPNELPYLHTIIYTLEGLLVGYTVNQNEEYLICLKNTVDTLVRLNQERDHILYAQYNRDWGYLRKEKCLVGLAQWSKLLLGLFKLIPEANYFNQAAKTIQYLKSKQIQNGSDNILGSLPGSMPIWGSYFRFSFNNWTVKYFIDAIILLGWSGAYGTEQFK